MACSVASDDVLTTSNNEDFDLVDILVTDQAEADSIPEHLPEMEQEVVISLPNSASTSIRAKPQPFSQINVCKKTYTVGSEEQEEYDLIVDETIPIGPYELLTQTTVAA